MIESDYLEKGPQHGIIGFSRNHINVLIHMQHGNQDFRLTGLYGAYLAHIRHKSWQLLRTLSNLNQVPWVVDSGFNEILHAYDKVDARDHASNHQNLIFLHL